MKKAFLILANLLFTIGLWAQLPYQNPNLNSEERAKDLISRLTLEEKAILMCDQSNPIPRLGIKRFNWWSEALHGFANNDSVTVFPEPIGMAASFNDELVFKIFNATSDEARAKYNQWIKRGNENKRFLSLSVWTPNVNIFRDPRWGRGQETYGEDPYLTSRMGIQVVKGLQGPDDSKYRKLLACAKHYAVHSGPEWSRHELNLNNVNPRDLYETYLPAFKALVQDADVEAVMCAYNAVYNEPCCGNTFLLQDVLRKSWGFKGHIVSDCGALDDFHAGHKVTKTPAESAAKAVMSGVNVNCGNTYSNLGEAVKSGLVQEVNIDAQLLPMLITRFKLGLFDPPEMNPYNSISADVINCEEHQKLAREVAQKSIVLLKNNKQVLPLKKDLRKLYLVGPYATSAEILLGNYYGVSANMVTILEGITGAVSAGTTVEYKYGFLPDRPNVNPIDWSTGDAGNFDATIVTLGISGLLEGEEGESVASPSKGDRFDLALPQCQIDYLKKIRAAAGDKPLIAIITGGSPVLMNEVYDLADAIIWVWYPGEQGGAAIADVIFGDVNPSGRLPLTFPKSVEQLPAYEDYSMTNRTYRYMKDDPFFPFGFGLSYTQFEYSAAKVSKPSVKKDEKLQVEVMVKNTGSVKGEEVVQLYLTDVQASAPSPLYAMKGFKRVMLNAGESKTVSFEITPQMMELITAEGEAILEKGDFKVTIGGSSPGKRSAELGAAAFATASFKLE